MPQFSQQGPKLVGTLASGAAQQGAAVVLSADGNTAIVGGPGENNGLGAAWVMSSGNVWTSQGQLSAPDASGAAQQGSAVSISSGGITTIAMVGAPANNAGQGAVWVYRRTLGLSWMEGPELVDTGA